MTETTADTNVDTTWTKTYRMETNAKETVVSREGRAGHIVLPKIVKTSKSYEKRFTSVLFVCPWSPNKSN